MNVTIAKNKNAVLPLVVLSLGLGLILAGCGGESGPPRYEISGKATFGGQPIPAGSILFIPDVKSKNKGPRGVATIKDGQYRTVVEQGAVAGPQLVQIAGYNGIVPPGWSGSRHGAAIFPMYTMNVELPAETTSIDFNVPARR